MKKMMTTILASVALIFAKADPPVGYYAQHGYCAYGCTINHTHHYNPYGHGYKTGHHQHHHYEPRPVIRPVYGHVHIAHHSAPSCMGEAAFQNLKYAMSQAWFEDTRLRIARQGIAAHGVSSAQVLELMYMLDFESSRLELAKFAYRYTFDPENYFVVNNGFSFDSSIASLQHYISHYW